MKNSEPTPELDVAAPRPWLSGATAAKAAGIGQVWSSSQDVLVVSYPFVKREYFRLLMSSARQNMRMLIRINTLLGFVLGGLPLTTMATIFNAAPPSTLAPTASMWRHSILFWVGATILMPTGSAVFLSALFALIAQLTEWTAKNNSFRITLSPKGVERQFESTEILRWQDVRSVEAWEGGVLIAGKFGRARIGVPGSAFADADAAERFSKAAHILWKSNGDMDLVPETTRAEFAPSSQS
jgi:hypothetical protein